MKNNKFLIVYILLFVLSIVINFNDMSFQYFCSLNTVFLIYLIFVKLFDNKIIKIFNFVFMILVLFSILNVSRYFMLLIIGNYDFIYSNFIMSIIHLVIYVFVFVSYFVKFDLCKMFNYFMAVAIILFAINSICGILNIIEFSIMSYLCSIILDSMVGYYMLTILKNNS